MEGFLGGLALERGGGGLAGRACFLEEEGFHSSWIDPTTRGKPASIFLSVTTLGDQHQDKAHRLHYTHTHTHDLNDDDDFLCQQHHRSGIAHTHILYRHTLARAAVMASRGTDGAAGGQVLVERNITATILVSSLLPPTVPFASTSPAFQPGGSRHIAPQRRMTMMNEGNKMGIPGLYDECI